jgi:hypothetical protein
MEAPEWVNREIATFVASIAEPLPSSASIAARRPSLARRALDWLTRLMRRSGSPMPR